jgi:cellulose biosynthesis protein BcsQ
MDTTTAVNQRRLFTWFDVESQIRQARAGGTWPKWLINISAYPDSVVATIQRGTPQGELDDLLAKWFGARFRDKPREILLESMPDKVRALTIEVDELEDNPPEPLGIEPTFKRVSLIPENSSLVKWPRPFSEGSPPLIAFYSFKGGVGRTTHLLACLRSLVLKGLRCLVVDADIEAPGITSLVNADNTLISSPFSLLDFLALAQSDSSSGWEDTLSLAPSEIQRNVLKVVDQGATLENYFLPAFRDFDQTLALDIKPEHLITSPGAEWNVGNLFAALGQRLKVDVVLIDLRAGLSELASPFLLDPRIRRVIVTTPSAQSLDGTLAVLKELSKVAPPVSGESPEVGRSDLFDPVTIISFLTPELALSDQLSNLMQRLISSYPDNPEDEPVSRLTIRDTSFAQELLYLNSFSDALDKLEGTTVSRVMAGLTDEMILFPSAESAERPSGRQIETVRNTLADVARRMEYAESGKVDNFLSISPLRLMAQHFRSSAPIAVVVGAKGSGKTFTYLQLVRSRNWSRFVKTALREQSDIPESVDIWPFLQSKNLDQAARDLVGIARKQTSLDLSLSSADLVTLNAEDAIRESLRHGQADLTWWRNRWFKLMGDSLGISAATDNTAASAIVKYLRDKDKQMAVVIDGLEDLFPELERSGPQQTALRALLQEVPGYLREIPTSPLGIVIFIRADLVSAAISQNEGQFRRLYEPYALRWNEEEALRLAAWIAKEAGAPLDLPKDRKLETISSEEAKRALVPVWGWKLGSEKAREAKTADWVIAALSDFRGQIQARDLVRLFRYAAEKSKSNISDRILMPRAIRDAIQPCSEEKIKEIEQEIPPLKAIFSKLQTATERKIPFDAAKSGLTISEIRFLEATGILIEDRGEYFMPEVFRLGLNFQLAKGARPRVLSLARRAVGKQLPQQLLNL